MNAQSMASQYSRDDHIYSPLIESLDSKHLLACLNYMLLTKYKDWGYENEWRFMSQRASIPLKIKNLAQFQELNLSDQLSESVKGEPINFPSGMLTAIYLGARISKENKGLLIETAGKANEPLKIYRSVPKEDRYVVDEAEEYF